METLQHRGVPVDEETLALDVIEELGPTGDYLQHKHTLSHFREPFYSKLFDKGSYARWEKRGRLTMEQRAAAVVDNILAEHTVAPLPEDVQAQIKAIVAREQKWIENK